MHDSIFIASQGSNVIVDIGALDKLKSKLNHIKYWNVAGNASLILFFKLLGYNYEQIFRHIIELKILSNTINGSTLMPENEEQRMLYMKTWLINKINKNKFFHSNVSLLEIYNHTNIFPAFILWSRNKQKIINVNAKNYPDTKLIDAVLASLTGLGFYTKYEIKNITFTNIFSVDCYPYLYSFFVENSNFFYLTNIISNINKKEHSLGPIQDKENELITQFCDHNNYRINNIIKTLPEDNVIKVYSNIIKGDITFDAGSSLFRNGQMQAHAFLEKRDTLIEYKIFLENINSQS